MKRILIFCSVCLMILFVMSTMVSCRSCGDKRVDDISKVPGIYEGQAELLNRILQGKVRFLMARYLVN